MATSVILLHGGGTSSRQWDLVTARIAGSTWPVASGHLPHVTMPDMIAALCDGVALDTDRCLAS
jgi:pimeloyl-ACP methyl ester carboxylesterase